MSEHERQGERGERSLEMRIAELENKLASIVAGPAGAHQPGAVTPSSSSFCFCYCYCFCNNCVIVVERSRGIYQQQAQASPGPVAPFMGGFPSMGY
jgi:hypothetical protein